MANGKEKASRDRCRGSCFTDGRVRGPSRRTGLGTSRKQQSSALCGHVPGAGPSRARRLLPHEVRRAAGRRSRQNRRLPCSAGRTAAGELLSKAHPVSRRRVPRVADAQRTRRLFPEARSGTRRRLPREAHSSPADELLQATSPAALTDVSRQPSRPGSRPRPARGSSYEHPQPGSSGHRAGAGEEGCSS
jgi:hypothetical protein